MQAKKSFGQNWLEDELTLNLIVDTAQLTIDDTVLEVGPGLATLTQKLIQKAGKVVAVEADRDLIPYLEKKFNLRASLDHKNDLKVGLNLIQGDILKFNLTKLPKNYKVVANIPYYLTSNLIRIFLESSNPPSIMVLLVQKEVAERIVANAGQMSILSFSVQYYARASIIANVSRKLFKPVPKVDSAIIKIERQSRPSFQADTKKLFRLVKIGFSQKRKKLRNSLSAGLRISTKTAEEILRKSKISLNARAQELSLKDWQRLYSQVNELNKLSYKSPKQC